jgi:hypothetical protein
MQIVVNASIVNDYQYEIHKQDKFGEDKEGWALQGHAQVNLALGTPCLGPAGLET